MDQISVVDDDSNDDEEVPSEFMFTLFFVFVLWGPFFCEDNRISLTLIDDKKKSKSVYRQQQRERKIKRKGFGSS